MPSFTLTLEDGKAEGDIKVKASFAPEVTDNTEPSPAQWAGYKTLGLLQEVLKKAGSDKWQPSLSKEP